MKRAAFHSTVLAVFSGLLLLPAAMAEGPQLQKAKFVSGRKQALTPEQRAKREKQLLAVRLNEDGVRAVMAGKLADGMEMFRRAIANDATNPTFHYNLAGVYIADGKADMAVKAMETALLLNPRDVSFYNRLAEAHFANSQLRAAADSYQKVLELDPKFPQAALRLGTIYGMMQDFPKAEATLRTALVMNDKDPRPYSNLASVLIAQSKYGEALKLLAGAQGIQNSAEIELALAVANEGLKQKSEALKHYRAALKLDPKNKDVAARIEELEK